MILKSVAYDLTCFMKVFDFGYSCSVVVNIIPHLVVFSKGVGCSSGAIINARTVRRREDIF